MIFKHTKYIPFNIQTFLFHWYSAFGFYRNGRCFQNAFIQCLQLIKMIVILLMSRFPSKIHTGHLSGYCQIFEIINFAYIIENVTIVDGINATLGIGLSKKERFKLKIRPVPETKDFVIYSNVSLPIIHYH